MKKFLSLFLLLVFSASAFALNPEENKEINQIIEHFTNAWNHHEGHGSADDYTQDADFVNIYGMVFSGKEEIEARHIEIHQAFLKGSIFEVIDSKFREVMPNVVIALVYWKVSNVQKPGKESPHNAMKGVFTHVLLKSQNRWEITASQNTLIPN